MIFISIIYFINYLIMSDDDSFASFSSCSDLEFDDDMDVFVIDETPEDEKKFNNEILFNGKPTNAAIKRLQKDIYNLSKTEKHGYDFEFDDANIFKWTVYLKIDEDDNPTLKKDMDKLGIDTIQMEMLFSTDYPFYPPFCRIIKPRFKFMTGHITIGGSICMDLLTLGSDEKVGWMPSNDIESIILQIRSQILEGKPELDSNTQPYSLYEAKSAFIRMASKYGLKIKSGILNDIK